MTDSGLLFRRALDGWEERYRLGNDGSISGDPSELTQKRQ
jgi:hypothetical protein